MARSAVHANSGGTKSGENPRPRWVWRWVALATLVIVTAGIYWQVRGHDFVDYDDGDYVTANPQVTSGLSVGTITWAFTTGHASNWHPLTWISHLLDVELFGVNPGAHHLVSLGFHLVNTLLTLWALLSLTGSFWRSFMVAALFALHPLHVESVAWVSERKDVLSTFFFLLTLVAYARYGLLQRSGSSQKWLPYVGALLMFSLGLMSKPMLVTVPFLLLLLDYWPLGRFQAPKTNRLWLVVEKLPFLALAVLSSIVTFMVQKKGGAVSISLSLPARLENAVVSYGRYLSKMVWPDDLSVLYPHPGDWPTAVAGGSILVLGMITVAVIWRARKEPYLFSGWFWYVGTLVPVIGLVQVGIQSMADRYTYIPLTGVFVAVVWLIGDLAARALVKPEALAVGAVAVLAAFATITHRQVGIWKDTMALFTQAVRVTKNNYLAYNNLGYFLSKKVDYAGAITNYQASLKINPLYEDALNNMGHALAQQRRHAEAVDYYRRALQVKPDHVEVHNNLGNSLADLGLVDEAIPHYQFVLERKPDHADAHNNYGIALAMKGKLDEAITHFQKAIQFRKNYAGAHSNLGNAYAVQHKLDEAIQQYQLSLDINPKDSQAHNNLGNVYAEQGRLPEAVKHYETSLRLNGDNPEAHFNLATVLIRQGKREEAIGHCREALRLKPNYPAARQQLQALTGSPG